MSVSTHSRPKAAAKAPERLSTAPLKFQHTAARRRLPRSSIPYRSLDFSFNTQPPEGGCFDTRILTISAAFVSTHSRPKAAGVFTVCGINKLFFSTHRRPLGSPRHSTLALACVCVSTHSRPKAAATSDGWFPLDVFVSTHSRPKAAAQI